MNETCSSLLLRIGGKVLDGLFRLVIGEEFSNLGRFFWVCGVVGILVTCVVVYLVLHFVVRYW